MSSIPVKTQLQLLLATLKEPFDVPVRIGHIIELWSPRAAQAISSDEIRMPLYNALGFNLNRLGKQQRDDVENMQFVFLEHWLNTTQWSPVSFWEELGGLYEVMNEKNPKVNNVIVKKLGEWIVSNRDALEHAYFTSPRYPALRGRTGGVNSDFSIFVRQVTVHARDSGSTLDW